MFKKRNKECFYAFDVYGGLRLFANVFWRVFLSGANSGSLSSSSSLIAMDRMEGRLHDGTEKKKKIDKII